MRTPCIALIWICAASAATADSVPGGLIVASAPTGGYAESAPTEKRSDIRLPPRYSEKVFLVGIGDGRGFIGYREEYDEHDARGLGVIRTLESTGHFDYHDDGVPTFRIPDNHPDTMLVSQIMARIATRAIRCTHKALRSMRELPGKCRMLLADSSAFPAVDTNADAADEGPSERVKGRVFEAGVAFGSGFTGYREEVAPRGSAHSNLGVLRSLVQSGNFDYTEVPTIGLPSNQFEMARRSGVAARIAMRSIGCAHLFMRGMENLQDGCLMLIADSPQTSAVSPSPDQSHPAE